jgi:DNA-binding MarR family transcriptional regulator
MKSKIVQEVVEIIELWDRFRATHTGEDTRAFAFWLLNETKPKERIDTAQSVRRDVPALEDKSQFAYYNHLPINPRISSLLRRLGKFQHLQTKRILQSLGILHLDEFGYMASLHGLVNANRTELNNINLNEHTTGTAIVKRLQEAGFIEERIDKEDKRSKKIRLTAKGRDTVMKAFGLMTQMADEFFAVYNKEEKEFLIKMFTRLNEKLTHEYFEK